MMDFNAYDEEIQAAEQVIALNRMEFEGALSNAAHQARTSARNALTSPWFLAGALGFGLMAGKLMFSRRPSPQATESVAKKSLAAIVLGAAFSMAQAHFGGPVGMARWAMMKLGARGEDEYGMPPPNPTNAGSAYHFH